jgi:hypothetical protein
MAAAHSQASRRDALVCCPIAAARARIRDHQPGTRHEMNRPRAGTGAEEKNLLSYVDRNERRYQRHHESPKGSSHAP